MSYFVIQEIMGLDGVELIIAVEDVFGITISDAVAASMITPAILISHVQEAVRAGDVPKPCISLRAFHKVRASLMRTVGVSRTDIALDTPIRILFPSPDRVALWNSFRQDSDISTLPPLRFGRGWLFSPTRVSDLVSIAVLDKANQLREERTWTNEEVRQVIREIIRDQLGIEKFNDSDEFVRDLGID